MGELAEIYKRVKYLSDLPLRKAIARRRREGTMDFGYALNALKEGLCVCRSGWNGKGMYIFLVPSRDYLLQGWEEFEHLPFIAMKTADNKVVPWLASQTDMLATDWAIVRN